jgi:hypothetical protein
VSRIDVYWFDDRGQGQCRVPQSWTVQYRVGDAWKPVESLTPYTTSRDVFNRVKFHSVTTTSLRLDVQLQPEFGAGVLEWKVE